MKICTDCNEELDIINFYINKGRAMSVCKSCHKKQAVERTNDSRKKSDFNLQLMQR